jgi:hypothetical protein
VLLYLKMETEPVAEMCLFKKLVVGQIPKKKVV